MAKRELLATLRDRYRSSSKGDKSRILDEFIAVTGHHRKHGIRLLGQLDDDEDTPRVTRGQRIYDAAIRAAVTVIWEAVDRICGKRLQAALSLRYTSNSLAVRRRGLPLLSWVAAPEELNPSQNRGGTVVSTKYPNPSGARRHWRWRIRVNRAEALAQARAEELTLVAPHPDGDDERRRA